MIHQIVSLESFLVSQLRIGRPRVTSSFHFHFRVPHKLLLLHHVTCVVAGNGLHGSIPVELGLSSVLSSSLLDLQLQRNALTGSIPTSFGGLTSLTSLDLSENSLTGALSANIKDLESLEILNLGYNDFDGMLFGGLPTSFFNLKELNVTNNVNLQGGPFGGDESYNNAILSPLKVIELLDISNCSFSGQIRHFNFRSLKQLRADDNMLSGHLPQLSRVPMYDSLEVLTMNRNNLVGVIPWSEMMPDVLHHLELAGNSFSGDLATSAVSEFTNLQYLDLSYNELESTIPTAMGELTQLTALILKGNLLSGTVPTELSQLSNLGTFP